MPRYTLIRLSVFTGFLLIIVFTIQWYLYEHLNIFVGSFVVMLSLSSFIGTFILAILFPFFKIKKYKFKSFIPLLVHLLTVVFLIIVPITNIMIKINFSQNKAGREKIITYIRGAKIGISLDHSSTLITLPKQYTNMSSDGVVKVVKEKGNLKVFFYTFRGILDNFSGFIYSDKPNDPSPKKFMCDPVQTEKIDSHWYWVSCT